MIHPPHYNIVDAMSANAPANVADATDVHAVAAALVGVGVGVGATGGDVGCGVAPTSSTSSPVVGCALGSSEPMTGS
ncbi:hypothetical protein ATCC90586_012102 [Pythium insidiosum]|nr:hypothetical protein ATCC90586_012102 [Pythium insidiosum]